MTRNVLITAFQPYDDWEANSSWLTLVELTRTLPEQPSVTTRLLPVDFDAAYEQLQRDLTANYDLAIHLGQAPGNSRVAVECVGLNVRGERHQSPGEFTQLVKDGVTAYHSQLPLQMDVRELMSKAIYIDKVKPVILSTNFGWREKPMLAFK